MLKKGKSQDKLSVRNIVQVHIVVKTGLLPTALSLLRHGQKYTTVLYGLEYQHES